MQATVLGLLKMSVCFLILIIFEKPYFLRIGQNFERIPPSSITVACIETRRLGNLPYKPGISN